jgi:hypothetical protein
VGSLIEWCYSSDIDELFCEATSNSDGAVVVDCNDVIWAIAFATRLGLSPWSHFADLVSNFIVVGMRFMVLLLLFRCTYGENHVSFEYQLSWGCSKRGVVVTPHC